MPSRRSANSAPELPTWPQTSETGKKGSPRPQARQLAETPIRSLPATPPAEYLFRICEDQDQEGENAKDRTPAP